MAKPRTGSRGRQGEQRPHLPGPVHQGIEKRRPRRSVRLKSVRASNFEEDYLAPSPASEGEKDPTSAPEVSNRKRKREHDSEEELQSASAGKRRRASAVRSVERTSGAGATNNRVDPIDHWRKEGYWPKQYFKQKDSMIRPLARKRSSSSLGRKNSDVGSSTPSDQKPREGKSKLYSDARYPILLETHNVFMVKDKEGPKKESRDTCRYLLSQDQDVPSGSRFSDHVFEATCRTIQNKNEAKVIQDITRLIVPSVERFADFGAEHLECLVESVNEGWNNSIPITKTRPQPDYSVGFKRTAFTKPQLDKLQPFIGDFLDGDLSFFMATFSMYFPFLACEVKCGAAALNIADRQNAHSMALAARGVVELFKLVKRENEINREILAFSVSHDHNSVRIYGHYPVIKEEGTQFFRYPIHDFSFTVLDGKDKWTAYKFTKNLYDTWMPKHFDRLRSIIDELPVELDCESSYAEGTRIPQISDAPLSRISNPDSVSVAHEDVSHSYPSSEGVTPNTSLSQPGLFKKPRTSRTTNN